MTAAPHTIRRMPLPPSPGPHKPPHIREFTPRSIVVGLLVALVIGASYPYMVLKFGFGPNISVVSAFFGFLALGLFSRSYNRWENNIVQTAGTSAGQLAFLCWLLAAFDLMRLEPGSTFDVNLTAFQTWAWLTASGLLGVFLAVPLRKHFIDDENLPFPDGIAAGETLIALDAHGPQARKSALAMMAALVASGLVFLATVLQWIRDTIPLVVNDFSPRVGLGFGVSLLSIGSGIIIGLRISASMLLGGILAWVVMPPWLVSQGLLAADGRRGDVLLLVMWPSVGLLVAGGMCALLLRWRVLMATFRSLAAADATSGDLSLRWVGLGAGVCTVALIAVQSLFFATPVWHSVLAILLSVPLGLVALRVLGETNWGPISTMTNVMQAMFAVIAPGDLRASMVSSGITGAVAAESEGLMQDFRAGAMIGSTPRILTYMQLLAVPVGALALAVMYPLLRDTYGIARRGRTASQPHVAALGRLRQAGDAGSVGRRRERRGHGAAVVDADLDGRRSRHRRRSHAARAAQVVAAIRAVAGRRRHRDGDPGERGHRDLPWCRARLGVGARVA